MSLITVAAKILDELRREGVSGCLVGGLAVSARCDPRFTRDIDVAIAIEDDARAEALVQKLGTVGFRAGAVAEQEAVGRLAMIRFIDDDDTTIDMLTASSGIEAEVVADAESLEVVRGVIIPVARVGHLIALKLLSVSPGRETDALDLRHLAAIATSAEWDRAADAVEKITARGYARGRDLTSDLRSLRSGNV